MEFSMPGPRYNLSRIDLTESEYADLAVKDQGTAYFVSGVLRSIGGQTVGGASQIKTIAGLPLSGVGDVPQWRLLAPNMQALGVAINFTALNTAQMAAMMAGGTHGYIITSGDSWPAGFGSGGGSGNNGSRIKGLTGQLVASLIKRGIRARYSSYCGTGIGPGAPTASNAALWHGNSTYIGAAAFLSSGGFDALGAFLTSIINAGTDGLDLNFQQPFDTVDTLYALNTSHGTMTLAADGGAVQQSISTNAAAGMGFSSVTVNGLNTLNIRNTGANIYPCAFVLRDSTKPGINVLNASVGGMTLQTLAVDPATAGGTKTWAARAGLTALLNGVGSAKKVVLLNGWYNDRSAGRTLVQARADLATLITTIKAAGGEPWYIGYSHLSPASITSADFNSWYDGMLAQCIASDIPAIDLRPTRESFNYGNQVGLYYDALHNNALGSADAAELGILPSFLYARSLQ
jgi:hypothetical protein